MRSPSGGRHREGVSRFGVSLALSFGTTTCRWLILIAEGNLGLPASALEKFEIERGVRFGT